MKHDFSWKHFFILLAACSICLLLIAGFSGKHEEEEVQTAAIAQEPTQAEEQPESVHADLSVLETLLDRYCCKEHIDKENLAYAICNLENGEELVYNGSQEMTAASTYKLPLAMVFYEKALEGEIDLSDRSVHGRTSYEQLLETTIVYSANETARALYEDLGGWTSFRKASAKYSHQQMSDAFCKGQENIMTALYMQDVLLYLYEHQEEFETLMEHLQIAEPENYLNKSLDCQAYQKYGAYGSAVNAVGLVLSSSVPYSVAIYTDSLPNGEKTIGEINQLVFQYFDGQYDGKEIAELLGELNLEDENGFTILKSN